MNCVFEIRHIHFETLIVSAMYFAVTRKLRSDLQEVSDEQRLFRKLMRKYEKSVRPVINATTPVVVKLGITLTQIFDMVSSLNFQGVGKIILTLKFSKIIAAFQKGGTDGLLI